MEDIYKKASKNENILPEKVIENLNTIFTCKPAGFREITFLIAMTKLLHPEFKATEDFYEYNPRPFYEQGMKLFFENYNIPHKQSGPLNVAKGIKKIDIQWARGKRPEKAGIATVELSQYIDNIKTSTEVFDFTKILMQRFIALAEIVKDISVEHVPLSHPKDLTFILTALLTEAVDGGNTPQRVIGYIIEQSFSKGFTVSGHEDSASTTNTTSKKPGDVQVEDPQSKDLLAIYEITVKKFNEQRIQESYMSINSFLTTHPHSKIKEIIVICRPEDAYIDITKKPYGTIEYHGIRYHFIDIYKFIEFKMYDLPLQARLNIFSKIDSYIQDFNTSIKVKNTWHSILQKFS